MIDKFTKKRADSIVDNSYEKNKHKTPLTHAAGNAVKYLGFTHDAATNTYKNFDGQTVSKEEAIKINKNLNENFKGQKTDNYLAKHPDYTKLENVPILNRKITQRTTTAKTNPTIERYKQFREEKKFKEEEKKFNQEFEKEYSDQAIENYVRAKVHKNKRAGKADYEDLPSHYLIVGEHAKDRAKAQLKLIKEKPVQLELPDVDILLENEVPQMPDFKTYMQSVTSANDPDLDAGIAGLDGVKNFKDTIDLTDLKFPKKARGIGPYLTGEDENNDWSNKI